MGFGAKNFEGDSLRAVRLGLGFRAKLVGFVNFGCFLRFGCGGSGDGGEM